MRKGREYIHVKSEFSCFYGVVLCNILKHRVNLSVSVSCCIFVGVSMLWYNYYVSHSICLFCCGFLAIPLLCKFLWFQLRDVVTRP